MTERVKQLKAGLTVDKYKFCFEKGPIVHKSFMENGGWPIVIKRARATRDYLDNKTIYIDPGELIVGNVASVPMGLEVLGDRPQWTDEELDGLIEDGLVEVTEKDREFLRNLNKDVLLKGYSLNEWIGFYLDDERLWPFMHKGFHCPAWPSKQKGIGEGYAGDGWGFDNAPLDLFCPDYGAWIHEGVGSRIETAKKRLKELRYYTMQDCARGDFFTACLDVFPAIIRLSHRYADLAEKMAGEEKDEKRKAELLQIAETCRWVPEHPARTFREGIQSFWFNWIMIPSGTTPGGRFDQYMWPLYKADIEAGRITREEALELIECLRIKIMQFNQVYGGKKQRDKWAGMARWNNFVIGGCDETGKEASNDLTYLMLEAAIDCQTPHPTLTLRVSKDTPEELLVKAFECVRTGCGFPAMISEDQYIQFVVNEDVPIEEARKFAIAGCLDVQLPGKSRNLSFCMFIVPLVIELAMNDGCDPKTGEFLGAHTGKFEDFKTYEEFYNAFLENLKVITDRMTEYFCIMYEVQRRNSTNVVAAAFFDGWEDGIDCLSRQMLFENGEAINVVGMSSVCNSMAVIKNLVFGEKKISPKQMMDAIKANWAGYEDIQKMCREFPKYGNNDPVVDDVAVEVWKDVAKVIRGNKTIFGRSMLPTGISITAHAPGGQSCGPTPDGRFDGETFADGSTSPTQGTDKNGPLAVFQSAMKLPQQEYMATLMNMKFSPNALKTEDDLKKISAMTKTYLTNGGKHVQFNVVSAETLKDAKEHKEKYKNLIVRVAGYSAYYTTLTDRIQQELIDRTEQNL